MNTFDGLDEPKHQRVARALEQVNGLRYRYHPAPQEAKQVLRFDLESDEDSESGSEGADEAEGDERQRRHQRRANRTKTKLPADALDAPVLTLDQQIENLLHKTRTLAMLKIANNTAKRVACDSDEDEDESEAGDVVPEELASASTAKLSSYGSVSSSSSGRKLSGVLGGAALRLARTLSAFLCLPHAISYGDLEAITETLLDAPEQHGDEEDEYAHLIDYHVDSARDDEERVGTANEQPIWKRRKSNPIRPLSLSDDPGDLELHQRQMFMEANRFGGASTRNFFLASSRHLLQNDPNGSMYLGTSPSGRLLNSSKAGSNASIHSSSGISSNSVGANDNDTGAAATEMEDAFNEEEYLQWRTQVKADYLAWLNAKVEAEARKRRKSRAKKVDPNQKPRWLLLYEASQNPTRKYRPDSRQ